jgi:hypothetical protein
MNAAGWTVAVIGIAIALWIAWRLERNSRRDDPRDEGLEFMSVPWLAMAKSEITRALSGRNLDVAPFTLSEEFVNPPEHLRRGGDTIGFSVRVGDGRVAVGDRPDPGADCRVISDYDDALAVARDARAGAASPEEAERRVAEGRVTIVGDASRMPAVLQEVDLHRLLAEHTR